MYIITVVKILIVVMNVLFLDPERLTPPHSASRYIPVWDKMIAVLALPTRIILRPSKN